MSVGMLLVRRQFRAVIRNVLKCSLAIWSFGRSHSLFLPRSSLFFEIVSLLICLGNYAKNRSGIAASCHKIGLRNPEIALFPVKFPAPALF
jgi:hypothetical protein